MPDFRVRVLGFDSDFAIAKWVDPPIAGDPTRLNTLAHVDHRYMRTRVAPTSNTTLELRAIVAGVEAPADGALGGRLFEWVHSLRPLLAPVPMIVFPIGGKTSVAQVRINGAYPGHYRILATRPGSGVVAIPFDVEIAS